MINLNTRELELLIGALSTACTSNLKEVSVLLNKLTQEKDVQDKIEKLRNEINSELSTSDPKTVDSIMAALIEFSNNKRKYLNDSFKIIQE